MLHRCTLLSNINVQHAVNFKIQASQVDLFRNSSHSRKRTQILVDYTCSYVLLIQPVQAIGQFKSLDVADAESNNHVDHGFGIRRV